MKIKHSVIEIIETKNSVRFERHEEEREYPDEGRHDDLCVVCGFSTYPACREWCRNEKILNERNQKT